MSPLGSPQRSAEVSTQTSWPPRPVGQTSWPGGPKRLSTLSARVGGKFGWPTLYGKSDRRTGHPILKPSPPATFGHLNVCAHDVCPSEAGGTTWKGGQLDSRKHPSRGTFRGVPDGLPSTSSLLDRLPLHGSQRLGPSGLARVVGAVYRWRPLHCGQRRPKPGCPAPGADGVSAVRRRVRGAGPLTRGPYAAAWQRPQGRPAGVLRADRLLEGYTVWAIGWSHVCRRYAGGVAV
ncbi:hypothetical protein P170DRAFT_514668, partial [Aspergillus steynii IBT 23096]